MRVLLLDGADGSVACRIHKTEQNGTLPRFSNHGRIECVTRSFLRLSNLTAVRGSKAASMVGPTDYWGNLECPHRYSYIIHINDGTPTFVALDRLLRHTIPKNMFRIDPYVTPIEIRWVNGELQHTIDTRKSIFPGLGIGLVSPYIVFLSTFDARGADLSSFRARLVPNHIPFTINDQRLPASEEYRIIAYEYGSSYAQNHPENIFLETHSFSQTITPLYKTCCGYVLLARRKQGSAMELVSIQIPFGYTLIIDPFCIHGDATLIGKYMMTMTSNHTTMRTAKTVLLASPSNQPPLRFQKQLPPSDYKNDDALVWYYNDSIKRIQDFKRRLKTHDIVFNPLSKAYSMI